MRRDENRRHHLFISIICERNCIFELSVSVCCFMCLFLVIVVSFLDFKQFIFVLSSYLFLYCFLQSSYCVLHISF